MRSSQLGEENKPEQTVMEGCENANLVKIIGAVRRGTDGLPARGRWGEASSENSLSEAFTIKSQPDGEVGDTPG